MTLKCRHSQERPPLPGRVLRASLRLDRCCPQNAPQLPQLLCHRLLSHQLSQEPVFSPGYYKWKTWCLASLFFPFPLCTVIRKSCFSCRIRRLLFCWPKTSRKQTEPPSHVHFTGTGLRGFLTSLRLTPVSYICTVSDEGGQSQR